MHRRDLFRLATGVLLGRAVAPKVDETKPVLVDVSYLVSGFAVHNDRTDALRHLIPTGPFEITGYWPSTRIWQR